jgi:hypothetical protein
MATAPDLTHVQPLGFFTRELAEADPAVEDAIRAELTREQDADRADRLGKYREPRRARGAGLGADQQICGRLSGPPLLPGLRTL